MIAEALGEDPVEKAVSKSPAANASCSRIHSSAGIAVVMPPISYSRRARCRRAMAPARSGAHATTLEIIES